MGGSSRSSVQKYNPFEIVVNTNIAGDSGVGNFELKLNPTESYRYYVDWGDGSTSASTTTTNLTHSYGVPGIYNVKIYGRFDSIYNNNTNEADKITDIISWGNVKWGKFRDSFEGCSNLTGMTTQSPILELMGTVDDMRGFFSFATPFNADLGSWDVSNVIDMRGMFSLSNFNNGGSPSISGWTTSNVQFMASMFGGTPFNQPIGSWDVSNVTAMVAMFQTASNFNQDIGSWDVSNVQFMQVMFDGATNFNNGGSPSISGWTTSNVTTMNEMFQSASNFNQDIGLWDTSSVISMANMFKFASSFNNGGSPSISGWTTSGVTSLRTTFQQSSFNQPIGSWDVTGVNNSLGFSDTFKLSPFNQDIGSWDLSNYNGSAFGMFNASSFNNGGSPSISGWTTSGITSMGGMFQSTPFNQPIGSWDVSNVESFSTMFNNASSFNQDIGSWDVSSSTSFNGMFLFATNFNNGGSPSISGWTFGNGLTNMGNMFRGTPFNQPIGSWDMSNVTDTNRMFYDALTFDQDIGSWDMSNVTSISAMFLDAESFNNGGSPSISGWTFNTGLTSMSELFRETNTFNQPIGSWDVSNVTNMSSMFSSASNFNQPIGSWDVSNVTNMSTMFASATNFNQDLSNWNVSGVTSMSNMLDNTAISVANYNSILTGWTGWDGTGATKTLQSGVTFGAVGLNYTSGSTAHDAHDYLSNTLGWTITDAGPI